MFSLKDVSPLVVLPLDISPLPDVSPQDVLPPPYFSRGGGINTEIYEHRILPVGSYQDRLRSLNLTTLLYRRQRYDLIQIFKIVNGLEDIDSERFFTFNDNLTRGHLFKISKPSINKSLRLNMFPVRSIDNWNNLSEDIVLSDSVASFKTKLDKYWSHKRFIMEGIY